MERRPIRYLPKVKTRVAQWAEEWQQKPYDSFKFVYTHTFIHPRTATTTAYGNRRCALTPLVDIHGPPNATCYADDTWHFKKDFLPQVLPSDVICECGFTVRTTHHILFDCILFPRLAQRSAFILIRPPLSASPAPGRDVDISCRY